jgi:hypothetical protein
VENRYNKRKVEAGPKTKNKTTLREILQFLRITEGIKSENRGKLVQENSEKIRRILYE